MPRTYTQAEVDLMIDAVRRLGNRQAAADELGIPRTTILHHTKDVVTGSPKGGGFNPLHADRHPERVVSWGGPVGNPCGTIDDRESRRPLDVVKPEPVAKAEPEPPADPIEVERERMERLRKLKYEQEAIKAIAGERSLRSHLTSLFESVAPVFPAPPQYVAPKPSPAATEETLLLHLSDWHAYEEVQSNRVFGLNQYDGPTFGRRVRKIVDTAISIKSRMELGGGWKFPKLVIAANGDFVSGTIHEVERHSDAPNVVMAVYGTGMVLSEAIRDLSPHFEEIEVFCTSGNHGRLPDARRMQMKDPLRNWDTLIYLFAQTALSAVQNVKFYIPNSYSVAYTVGDTRICQTHGHDIKSWNSIPFYGINRFATNINALMVSQSRKFDAFLLAHFHTLGSIEAAGAEYFVNGSLIGGTEFAVNALGRCDGPKQWMLGIHKEHGITHRWPLLGDAEVEADGYRVDPWN